MVGNPTGKGGWKKGQSGNPTGLRGRHIGDLSRAARAYAQLALETLVEICRKSDDRARLVAARELLDRGFGKPLQMIDASIMTKKLNELSKDELEALEARLLTMAGSDDPEPEQTEMPAETLN